MKTLKTNLMAILVLTLVGGALQASTFDDFKKKLAQKAEQLRADAAEAAKKVSNDVVVLKSLTPEKRSEFLQKMNVQLSALINRRAEIEATIRDLIAQKVTQKFDESQLKSLKQSIDKINAEIKNIQALFEQAVSSTTDLTVSKQG